MDPPSEMTTVFIALVFVVDALKELVTMFYCPVCKSQEIFPVAGGYVGGIYRCKDCGYQGALVLEIDSPDTVKNAD
jgi:transposase-like protein